MPSLFNTVRDLNRLREIAAVLARHGFDEFVQRAGLSSLVPLRKRPHPPQIGVGQRIRNALEELGPSFIKLGQIASTRADLLPPDIIAELSKLQESVPPVPFDCMRAVLEAQLGRDLNTVFASFTPEPMASASIGQVYRARLRRPGGEPEPEVVVKIQRPDISTTIERDADLLYFLAHAVERSIPEATIYSPVKMAQEFDRVMRAELDYGQEADNAERFRENFAETQEARFPKVFRDASSRRVITMEYLPGNNVFRAVELGASGEAIARSTIRIMARMIFEHGFFHADPHPGNLLILEPLSSPVLGVIDLGQVGRLTPKARDRLIDLLVAVGRKDHRAVADALFNLGKPTRKVDRAAFEVEVMQLIDRYLGRALRDIDATALLRDLLGGAHRYGLELPTDLLIMVKSLITIEGIARRLYPDLDLAEELRPHMLDIVSQRYSPERLTSDFFHLANRASELAGAFPARAEDILEDLRQGRLRIETIQPNLQVGLERASRRLGSALLQASLILGGSQLLAHNQLWPGLALFAVALLTLTYTSLVMLLSRGRRPK